MNEWRSKKKGEWREGGAEGSGEEKGDGETKRNKKDRDTGKINVPLSVEGLRQCHKEHEVDIQILGSLFPSQCFPVIPATPYWAALLLFLPCRLSPWPSLNTEDCRSELKSSAAPQDLLSDSSVSCTKSDLCLREHSLSSPSKESTVIIDRRFFSLICCSPPTPSPQWTISQTIDIITAFVQAQASWNWVSNLPSNMHRKWKIHASPCCHSGIWFQITQGIYSLGCLGDYDLGQPGHGEV